MSGKISLTFDDGPDPIWTPLVLDALEEVGVLATFFVVATHAERHPWLLRRAAEAGHGIAFHCTKHLRHDRMTAPDIFADADEGLRILGKLGHDAGDWRTPWGVVTETTQKAAKDSDLRLVGWTADSEDWRGEPSKVMLSRLAPGIGPGGVVLMHDGVGPGSLRDGCGETVELLAPLVSLCRSRGLEPVPVGELPGVLPDRNPGPVAGV